MQCALIKFVREVTGNEEGFVREFMHGHKTVRMNKHSHWSEHTDPITMVEGVSVSRVQFDNSRQFMCIS